MSMNLARDTAPRRPALSLVTRSDGFGQPSPLTPREQQCVILLAHGATDEEIAGELTISHATVRFHLDGARRKLTARSRAHLAALAVSAGIVRL
jgi:DNA-binding CsgD family transcriptional regulator